MERRESVAFPAGLDREEMMFIPPSKIELKDPLITKLGLSSELTDTMHRTGRELLHLPCKCPCMQFILKAAPRQLVNLTST